VESNTFQVVKFVADGPRKHIFPCKGEWLAVAIESIDRHFLGARYHPSFPQERKAALTDYERLFARLRQYRIDKLKAPFYVYNDNAAQNAYLHGCNPHSLGVCHCFVHIVQKLMKPLVKGRNLSAFFSQGSVVCLK